MLKNNSVVLDFNTDVVFCHLRVTPAFCDMLSSTVKAYAAMVTKQETLRKRLLKAYVWSVP